MPDDTDVLYRPTPLEQAHSLYLAQQVFHVAPKAPIHISGRTAVPFLTQSGVNRGTLRSIWTATDPDNIGTLASLTQFQLLLRLVSMAQAGILPAEGTPDEMRAIVRQGTGRLLALPIFSSVTIPPHDNLIDMYGYFVVDYGPPAASQDGGGGGGTGTGGSIILEEQQALGVATVGSIDDAFADMVPAADAPLPSLGDVSLPATTESMSGAALPSLVADSSTMGPDGLVGDATSISMASQNAPLSMTDSTNHLSANGTPGGTPSAVTDDDDDDFGDFEDGRTTSAPTVGGDTVGASSLGASPAISASLDSTGMDPLSMGMVQPQSMIGASDTFGSFSSDTPASAMSPSLQPMTEVSESFGSFSNTPAITPTATTIPASFINPTVTPYIDDNDNDNYDDDDDDDDFGGFEAAPTANGLDDHQPTENMLNLNTSIGMEDGNSMNAFGQPHVPTMAPSFYGTVGSLSDGTTPPSSGFGLAGVTTSLSVDDAFGDIPIQNAPLPALGSFGAISAVVVSSVATDSALAVEGDLGSVDDDDFGDFGEAVPTTQEEAPTSTTEAPVPTSDNQVLVGSFGNASAVTPSFPTKLSDTASQEAPVLPEASTGSIPAPTPTPTFDVFGDIAGADVPLPSLEQIGSVDMDSDVIASTSMDGAEGDDFGGFEEATPSASGGTLAVVEAIPSDFGSTSAMSAVVADQLADGTGNNNPASVQDDGFLDANTVLTQNISQSTENAPPAVPSALSFGQGTSVGGGAMRDVSALSYGSGFGGAVAADSGDPFSAFDSISDPSHAEAPALMTAMSNDSTIQTNDLLGAMPEEAEEDEDFGDFKSSDTASVGQTGILAPETTGDAFGAFDGAPSRSSTSAQNTNTGEARVLEQTSQEDGNFGGFDAAPSHEGPTGSLTDDNDEFGAFDTASSSAQLSANYEFGASGGEFIQPGGAQPPGNEDFGDFDAAPSPSAVDRSLGLLDTASVSMNDDFGAFDAAPTQQQSTALNAQADDKFGGFDAAPSQPEILETQVEEPSADLFGAFDVGSSQPEVYQTGVRNQFGSFDSTPLKSSTAASFDAFDDPSHQQEALTISSSFDAFGDNSAMASQPQENESAGDDFGVFDPATTKPAETQASVADDFGDFGDFGATPSSPVSTVDPTDHFGAYDTAPSNPDEPKSIVEDDFGGFNTAPSIPVATNDMNDEFGDFGGIPEELESPQAQMDDDLGTVQKDDLAAFDTETSHPVLAQGSNDDWGDFGTAPSQPEASKDGTNDDFDAFGSATRNTIGSAAKLDDTFGSVGADAVTNEGTPDDDWGDFEDVPAPAPALMAVATRPSQEQIRGLSITLSESVLMQKGHNGEHADLGECYEANIGMEVSLTPEKKSRVDRCIKLLKTMTTMKHKAGSAYWEQIFSVVNEELRLGRSILVEAGKLPSISRAEVLKPLQVMVGGLKEYIRVTRFIVATIGDMLMLESSALLTVDTMTSTWCSLAILDVALDIESKWKEIQKQVHTVFPALSKSLDVPSLEEIRNGVISSGGSLCELTLQPLSTQNKTTTRAPVSWNGRNFMACSANLLANRCPFYAAG